MLTVVTCVSVGNVSARRRAIARLLRLCRIRNAIAAVEAQMLAFATNGNGVFAM